EGLVGAPTPADFRKVWKGRLQVVRECRRPGDEIALDEIDPIFAAGQELGLCLDPLGDHPRAEDMSHMDNVLDEMALAGALVDIGDEMAVDLEIVDRVIAQEFHFTMTDAEIVNRQLEAGLAQLGDE